MSVHACFYLGLLMEKFIYTYRSHLPPAATDILLKNVAHVFHTHAVSVRMGSTVNAWKENISMKGSSAQRHHRK